VRPLLLLLLLVFCWFVQVTELELIGPVGDELLVQVGGLKSPKHASCYKGCMLVHHRWCFMLHVLVQVGCSYNATSPAPGLLQAISLVHQYVCCAFL
jgi:hypothetical protein